MLKSALVAGLLQILFTAPLWAQTDAFPCENEQPGSWVDVTVHGIMSDEGRIRAQIYSENPDDFLRKGKKLVRAETPSQKNQTTLCVPLPGPGQYSLVVMHDRKANGRADFYSDGFGFSNNPRLTLSAPDHAVTLFTAGRGGMVLDVFLKYMLFGRLSAGDPWASSATNGHTQQDIIPGADEIISSPDMN